MNFSPFPHSRSISSLSLHFLSVSSSFPHSLFISLQPGCKAATIRAALVQSKYLETAACGRCAESIL